MVRLAGYKALNAAPRIQDAAPGLDGAGAPGRPPEETPEAQEARLVALYQSALLSAAEGRTQQAIEGFQTVLAHPILAPGPDGVASARGTLRELRLLATRNLADQLGQLQEQQAAAAAAAAGNVAGEWPVEGPFGDAGGQALVLLPLPPAAAEDAHGAGEQYGAAGTKGPSIAALQLQLYGEAVLQQHAEAQDGGAAAGGDVVLWHRLADAAARDGRLGLTRYALEAGLAASGGRHVVLLEKLLALQLRADDLAGALATCRSLAAVDPHHPWLRAGGRYGGGQPGADGGPEGGDGLQQRLLALVDPQAAALQAFLERQKREMSYMYGGDGLSYDGERGDAAGAGDGWRAPGSDALVLYGSGAPSADADAAALGLPPLWAPALAGELPERLAPAVLEPGCELELAVPLAAQPRHAPSLPSPSATQDTAVAGLANGPTGDGPQAQEPGASRVRLDMTAALVNINRLLRGLEPLAPRLAAAAVAAAAGGAEKSPAARRASGAEVVAAPSTERPLSLSLFGAVLRLQQPQTPPRANGAALAPVEAPPRLPLEPQPQCQAQPQPQLLLCNGPSHGDGPSAADLGAALGPQSGQASGGGGGGGGDEQQPSAAARAARDAAVGAPAQEEREAPPPVAADAPTAGDAGTEPMEVDATDGEREAGAAGGGASQGDGAGHGSQSEGGGERRAPRQRQGAGQERTGTGRGHHAQAAAGGDGAPVRTSARTRAAAVAAPGPGAAAGAPEQPTNAAAATRSRAVSGGSGGGGVGAKGPAGAAGAAAGQGAEEAAAWQKLWEQLHQLVPPANACAKERQVAGALVSVGPATGLPPAGPALPGGRLRRRSAAASDGGSGAGAASRRRSSAGGLPGRGCRRRSSQGQLVLSGVLGHGSSGPPAPGPALDLYGAGPMGRCLLQGAGIHTVAVAMLEAVLAQPAALAAWPPLVRQTVLLEPYASHLLHGGGSGGGDGEGDAVAAADWALLAALHLDQALRADERTAAAAAAARQAAAGAASVRSSGPPGGSPTKPPRAGRGRGAAAATGRRPASGSGPSADAPAGAQGAGGGGAGEAEAPDGLGRTEPRHHVWRAEELLRRLLAATVLLRIRGGGGALRSGQAEEANYFSASQQHPEKPQGGEALMPEPRDSSDAADGPPQCAVHGATGPPAPSAHARALCLHHWLRGHLLQREKQVLEAQESFLACLDLLPLADPAAFADDGDGDDGAGGAAAVGCVEQPSAAAAGGGGARDAASAWAAVWSLPGCALLRPPSEAAVLERVRSLEIFRTMATAEAAGAAGEHERVVELLREVAFPPEAVAEAAEAAAEDEEEEEGLEGGAGSQLADLRLRAMQLLRTALQELLRPPPPSPPRAVSAAAAPVPPLQQQQEAAAPGAHPQAAADGAPTAPEAAAAGLGAAAAAAAAAPTPTLAPAGLANGDAVAADGDRMAVDSTGAAGAVQDSAQRPLGADGDADAVEAAAAGAAAAAEHERAQREQAQRQRSERARADRVRRAALRPHRQLLLRCGISQLCHSLRVATAAGMEAVGGAGGSGPSSAAATTAGTALRAPAAELRECLTALRACRGVAADANAGAAQASGGAAELDTAVVERAPAEGGDGGGAADGADSLLPAACRPWVRRLQRRLLSYLQALQAVSALTEASAPAGGGGPGIGRLNSRLQAAKALRTLTLDAASGVLACHRLADGGGDGGFTAAASRADACFELVTCLVTAVCCSRPGLAATVAAGHVAAQPPPPQVVAAGAGAAATTASVIAAASAPASAPWELMPFLREALELLRGQVEALAGAGSPRAGAGSPTPGLVALHLLEWREAVAEESDSEAEGDAGASGSAAPRPAAGRAASDGPAGAATAAVSPDLSDGDAAVAGAGEESALADLEALPPLRAAASVLQVLRGAGGAAAAAPAATASDTIATEATAADAAGAALSVLDAEQRVRALQRLCGAHAQLLWLMFGVVCPWRDAGWGFRLGTAAAAAEAAAAADADDKPSVSSQADALLLWCSLAPHAALLAEPPPLPGLSAEAREGLEEAFQDRLQDLLPALEFLGRTLPPLPEALVADSRAARFVHDPALDDLVLSLRPAAHLPTWLRAAAAAATTAATGGALTAPPLPAAAVGVVTSDWVPVAFARDAEMEDAESAGLAVGVVAAASEELAEQRRRQQREDPLWEVHSQLYFCLLRAQGLDAAADPQAGGSSGGADAGLLAPDGAGAAALAADAALVLRDLALNPLRLRSWRALQTLHANASRRLLQELAVSLEPGGFGAAQGPGASAPAQLARLHSRAVRAAVAAAHLDPEPESRCFHLEEIAVLHHDLVAPCYPLYDDLVQPYDARPAAVAAGAGPLCALSAAAAPPPDMAAEWQAEAETMAPAVLAGPRGGYRRDWRFRAACRVAGDMYRQAAAVLEDEWEYEYGQGLVAARHKAPGWRSECLAHLAAAAVRTAADLKYGSGGGLLAPLVALHGRRLRWLAKGVAARRRREAATTAAVQAGGGRPPGSPADAEKERLELLELCGRYCFQRQLALRLHPDGDAHSGLPRLAPAAAPTASAAAAVAVGSADGSGAMTVDQLEEVLIDDARRALLFASRSYRPGKEAHHYHPARYYLAQAELLLGRPDEADAQLRPLFTPARGRASFALATGLIGDRGFEAQKRKAAAAAAAARAEGQRHWCQQRQQQQRRAGSGPKEAGSGRGGPGSDPNDSQTEGPTSSHEHGQGNPANEGEGDGAASRRGGGGGATRRPARDSAGEEDEAQERPGKRPRCGDGGLAAAVVAKAACEEETGEGEEEEGAAEEERPAKEPPRWSTQPTALWAVEPQLVLGHGLEEEDRQHVTALRKCLAMYLRVNWERGDLATVQSAVPVLYGAADKQPYVRDLAALALGLVSVGAAEAACSALGLPLEEAARLVQARGPNSPAAGGGAGSPEQWLAAALEERLQSVLRAAEAEVGAAAEAEAAATAAAAVKAAPGADTGAGSGAASPSGPEAVAATATATAATVGEAAAAADGSVAAPAAGGGAEPSAADPRVSGRSDPGAMECDQPATAAQPPQLQLPCPSQAQPSPPQAQPHMLTRHQHGTEAAGAAGAAAPGSRSGPRAGGGGSSAHSPAGGAASRKPSGLAASPAWVALLDALAPLCNLNLDYWLESSSGQATGGAAAAAAGGGGGGGSRPSPAAAATRAAAAARGYGRAVPGAAAAAVLQEPLLRCFSQLYVQALRRTPELGPQRLQELQKRCTRRGTRGASRLAGAGLRDLTKAISDALAAAQTPQAGDAAAAAATATPAVPPGATPAAGKRTAAEGSRSPAAAQPAATEPSGARPAALAEDGLAALAETAPAGAAAARPAAGPAAPVAGGPGPAAGAGGAAPAAGNAEVLAVIRQLMTAAQQQAGAQQAVLRLDAQTLAALVGSGKLPVPVGAEPGEDASGRPSLLYSMNTNHVRRQQQQQPSQQQQIVQPTAAATAQPAQRQGPSPQRAQQQQLHALQQQLQQQQFLQQLGQHRQQQQQQQREQQQQLAMAQYQAQLEAQRQQQRKYEDLVIALHDQVLPVVPSLAHRLVKGIEMQRTVEEAVRTITMRHSSEQAQLLENLILNVQARLR
ncbi:hypothetical protein GPECTOR_9g508 [Gonium pectorale]|uniref:Uncharacterized protein n=1 Tax=Gonium pectorale TaxID=33097 RepID=A0A150GRQ3_GONPE|nr:hypothetical protein GPECTOR_9g508 [Gonium pectorale]|eukprot:KXZ52464.1 hypothetical protein GPECTOR_9g508 [Gonium pectorale]